VTTPQTLEAQLGIGLTADSGRLPCAVDVDDVWSARLAWRAVVLLSPPL
jgi:hypothetical protein